MALPGRKIRWRPTGLSDSQDGTNSFPGAMEKLVNLVPSPTTPKAWVCRPAAVQMTSFPGFPSPGQVSLLQSVGNIVYGMIGEMAGPFAGFDVPFAYNVQTQIFLPIAIPGGVASLPVTQATFGDWTPPTIAPVAGRIIITHPGYSGGLGPFFGWIDVSGFTDTTHTGDTHTSTLIDNLSANVLLAGWQVGMTVTGLGIQANTTIVSIAANGLSLTLSLPATQSHASQALSVAGGTAAAPVYSSGNTNGNALASVPVSVIQFNGRAFFAVGAGLTFSDAGSPCQVTNATQAFSFRNGLNVTALGPIGLFSSTVGGVIQSVMAFQGDAQIWQVQGDITFTAGLSINALNEGVGSLAPNTLTSTPIGLAFVAPDGFRIIDANGKIADPIGANGKGVCFPFLSVINPSRMTAAFNQNIMRITVQNGAAVGQPFEEYWLDFDEKIWSGPHTFPASQITTFQGTPGHGFTVAPVGVAGQLFTSSATPSVNDTYTENGVPLTYVFKTALLPDELGMSFCCLIASTLACAIANLQIMTVSFTDEGGTVLDVTQLNGPSQQPALWGQVKWGSFLWGGPGSFLSEKPLLWHQPLVFRQGKLTVMGTSALGTIISNFNAQIEDLDYTLPASFPPAPGGLAPTGGTDDGNFPVVNP